MTPVAAQTVIPEFGGGGSCVKENRTFCWDWFADNWSGTFQPALLDHIVLTVIGVAIGFAIALTAALYAHRHGWFEGPFTAVSGILYTIPSLALFQLLVPITGLTVTTAEIALVSYTLLILFRNVLTGLRGVPAEMLEAARGMGMTPRQIVWRVELPIALPAIVAGLRVAVVTVISLATVAALIIDRGLGKPIFDSINAPFNTAFIAAGALAVALALAADGLLVAVQRLAMPWGAVRR